MRMCNCGVCENRSDWLDEAPTHCEVCGAELDYSDFVYVVKGQEEVVGCEHCIKAVYAEEIENY